MQSASEAVQESAAYTLAQIAQVSHANTSIIIQEGGVQSLVWMLYTGQVFTAWPGRVLHTNSGTHMRLARTRHYSTACLGGVCVAQRR